LTTFYISPSSFDYQSYCKLANACIGFGWSAPWLWSQEAFNNDCLIYPTTLKKSIRAFSRVDIFIAYLPGTPGTMIEIGLAYGSCEELFICAGSPVYFIQTGGLVDAHLAALPKLRRAVCEQEEIAQALATEYAYLINPQPPL